MNVTGQISGIPVVFGARWDDRKDAAKFKIVFSDTIGYYDDEKIDRHIFPAPVIVHQVLKIEDDQAPYAVFYHDDEQEIFGSIIFSAGQVAPLSEHIYKSFREWESEIIKSTDDNNIDYIYLPDETIDYKSGKYRFYLIPEDGINTTLLPEIKPTSVNIFRVLIVIAASLVLTGIIAGAWYWFTRPVQTPDTEIQYRIEKTKPDFDSIMKQCIAAIKEPWPASPEWTLIEEGCVIVPEFSRVTFPKPDNGQPYSYRFYRLNGELWNDVLSHAAFQKIVERFPGEVIEGSREFTLYIPHVLEAPLVNEEYVSDVNPKAILQTKFFGAIDMTDSDGVITAVTGLEFENVINRLFNQLLTPNHIYRKIGGQGTSMSISAEKINIRKIAIENPDSG